MPVGIYAYFVPRKLGHIVPVNESLTTKSNKINGIGLHETLDIVSPALRPYLSLVGRETARGSVSVARFGFSTVSKNTVCIERERASCVLSASRGISIHHHLNGVAVFT